MAIVKNKESQSLMQLSVFPILERPKAAKAAQKAQSAFFFLPKKFHHYRAWINDVLGVDQQELVWAGFGPVDLLEASRSADNFHSDARGSV